MRVCGPRFEHLSEEGGVGGGGLLIAGAGESSGQSQAAPPTSRSWDYTPGATTSASRQSEGCCLFHDTLMKRLSHAFE
jgi:hypothetical protein